MRVGFLITARLKSTRLPRKVLLEIEGRPILRHMIDRIRVARRVSEIVVCTSTNPQDDPLEELARKEGVGCFRGHEEDVIRRLHDATVRHGFAYVISATADCPFVDPGYADEIVAAYERTGADLIRALDLPLGAFSYGLKPAAMARVVEIKDDEHTEVWGRYFTETGLFQVHDLPIENPAHRAPHLRMTLDYPEDFEFFKTVFAALYRPGRVFSLDEILTFLAAHPEVVAMNSTCMARYQQRIQNQGQIRLKPEFESHRGRAVQDI